MSVQPDPSHDAPWHALATDDVLTRLASSHHGLSEQEAKQRLARYGPNSIRTGPGVRPWAIFLHQFTSPLIYILLLAMVITLVTGHVADSIVIAMVLTLNATIGFIQEYRAENAMQALMKMVTPQATVRRDGERCEIPSSELVPGDIVLLESGDLVPADVRMLEASQLHTDDSILTGESVVVGKNAEMIEGGSEVPLGDRRNMAFMGTAIASGRARAVVVATGANTQIGQIAGEMRSTERAQTPLQARMHRFGNRVSIAIVLVCTVAFIVGLLQGVPATEMFLTAVAIAVAAIPEGLPIVMTVALAVSVRKMAKRNAIIRRLPAVETLGSCGVIMSDKTGTLTENRMTVQAVWAAGERFEVTGTGLSVEGEIRQVDEFAEKDEKERENASGSGAVSVGSPLYFAILAGMLANESDLRKHPDHGNGQLVAHGDPTEVALLVVAAKAKLKREELLDAYPQVAEIPFESERQFSATIHKQSVGEHELIAFVKGAPERVLEMCDETLTGDGAPESPGTAIPGRAAPIDSKSILDEAHRMAGEGLRVLAMAIGTSNEAIESTRHAEPKGLTFAGLVGMMDPPRPEVIDAIRKCHRAGIRVIMCTGDHASTAAAIAVKIGLVPELEAGTKPQAVTGAELLEISDDELKRMLKDVHVFARVSPQQKLRIVNMIRELGDVVAVTGDGVNDAPALKSAHIGCAMGISGTDVAKEASEMVLADDNFATIYAAVEEGRTAFSNIRKATDFLISTSVGVVLAIFGTFLLAAFGVFALDDEATIPLLLLPAQILWLNVVTNGIQDVALAFEPGEEHQYLRPPRDPKEGLMSKLLVERTILVGLLLAAVALAMFTWELNRHDGETFAERLAYAQAATLTAMVIFKMLHVGACRSETLSIFQKNVFSNPVLFIGTSVSLAVHLGAMYFGPTQFLLGLQPLTRETWLAIIIAAPSVLVLVELHKLLRSDRWEPGRATSGSGAADRKQLAE
jgi:cation-transporting P-type ATPase F